jgi:hypothetical protein
MGECLPPLLAVKALRRVLAFEFTWAAAKNSAQMPMRRFRRFYRAA